MRRTVGVVDTLPAYRRGLILELEDAGYAGSEPGDPLDWARQEARNSSPPRPALLLTLRDAPDLEIVSDLRLDYPDMVVVVLLPDPSAEAFQEALTAGASGAVAYDAPGNTIVAVLQAALDGHARLPIPVARAFAARWGDARETVERLTSRDIRWLRALASGWTVVRLADEEGYSRREMFRRLNDLYRRLGVANRHEAVAQAAHCQLLEEASATTP